MALNQILLLAGGGILFLVLLAFAFAGPSAGKTGERRLEAIKGRHAGSVAASVEQQMRKIAAARTGGRFDGVFARYVPNPDLLRKRLSQTGKNWSLGGYAMISLGLTLTIGFLGWMRGAPLVLALLAGLAIGLMLPHMVVGSMIKRRIAQFNARFPDAIELMVRGLRSGLPISETLGIVAAEVPEPVGSEFQSVADRIRIGKTMDAALDETAERLDTPEFKFFCISLSIQRETGGNLAETLSNLAEVLRKRAQMKLKIRAMSSESKASAYIIGVLPFGVFGLIYYVNPGYMGKFFLDERLMVAGLGGIVWMGIGAFIMAKMINFEI